MKTTKIFVILALLLGFMACHAHGDLTLPYTGRASTPDSVFSVNNTGNGIGIKGEASGDSGIGVYGRASKFGGARNTGGYFEAIGGYGRGIYARGSLYAGEFEGDLIVSGGTEPVYLDNDGRIGIGTTSPGKELEVICKSIGGGVKVYGDASTGTLDSPAFQLNGKDILGNDRAGGLGLALSDGHFSSNAAKGDLVLRAQDASIHFSTQYPGYPANMTIKSNGNVGIGTDDTSERLTVRGNILVQSKTTGQTVMQLGEGLDYAEGFDVSGEKKINPGNVLIIDPTNPGKLTLSHCAYDTKVGGIIAGAKGQGSGVRLGAGQFDYDVALAGRVYCNVDATTMAVEPGDLLTTSDKPGYAMKAVDYARARGAILGKAMEKLEKGKKGQILVLVTLQ